MTGVLFLALVSLAGPAMPGRAAISAGAMDRHLYVPTGVAVPVEPAPGTTHLSGLFQPARLAPVLAPVLANAKAVPALSLSVLIRGSGRPAIRASACSL